MKCILPAPILATVLAVAELPAVAQQPAAAPRPAAAQQPAAAPVVLLYTNNLVANPGFEKGFERDRKKGWVSRLENGMEAKFESAVPNRPVQPFEGRKALRLFVKDMVRYSKKDFESSWEQFVRASNGGKGGALAEVQQLLTVRPGARYALRFRWRAIGIYRSLGAGPNRGLVEARLQCDWLDSKYALVEVPTGFLPYKIPLFSEDSESWSTFAIPDFEGVSNPKISNEFNKAAVAPAGAAYLKILFRFTCLRPKVKPELWLDQIELVELPPDLPDPSARK